VRVACGEKQRILARLQKNHKQGQADFLVCTYVKSFVWRHHKLIPFFGALIISLTLVVRDDVRERSKSLADSISNAETAFHIEDLIKRSMAITAKLRDSVSNLTQSKGPWSTDNRPAMQEMLDNAMIELEILRTLVWELPRTPGLADYSKELNILIVTTGVCRKTVATTTADGILWSDLYSLEEQRDKLQDAVLREARHLRESEEIEYMLVSYASYATYVLAQREMEKGRSPLV
jgi:hypothetical protein